MTTVATEARRSAIRKYLEEMTAGSALARREFLLKNTQGAYDVSLGPLCQDVLNEGIDPEVALEGLARVLREELPTLEKRQRKPVDRRLAGITDSHSSRNHIERSTRCGVCFQAHIPCDDWCDVCGLGVHSACGQFEGMEAPPGSISPFRVDIDKGSGLKTCGYCRASRKMTSRGVKDISGPSQVVCEVCNQSGHFGLMTNLGGAATKWVHVCCGRYLPGSSIGLTGARRYGGIDKDTLECTICGSQIGIVTKCTMCEEESAANVHVFCALALGGYGVRPLDPAHPQRRLLCPEHKAKMLKSLASSFQARSSLPGSISSANGDATISALQGTFHPLGTEPRCGVCLSTEVPSGEEFLVCDGCDVRLHASCFLRSTGGGTNVVTPQGNDLFYCNRCSDRDCRGSVGKCSICPHQTPMLALQNSGRAKDEFFHSLCYLTTPPQIYQQQPALQQQQQQQAPQQDGQEQLQAQTQSQQNQRKCELCGTKTGVLIPCMECPKSVHAICVLLLCEEQRNSASPVTRCLNHCSHPHKAISIAPITLEFPIGTAFRMYRREASGAYEFAFNKASRDEVNILKEWKFVPEDEKNAILGALPQPPSEKVEIAETFVQRTLAAIARAWEQTKAESIRKRGRLMGNIPSAGGSRAGSSNHTRPSSSRNSRRSSAGAGDEDEDDERYSRAARPLQQRDAPIEVCEVWPLLEPVFRKPASTTRIIDMFDRDRTCDEILLRPNLSILPETKMFPDQPYSRNPYVPSQFQTFAPLERSRPLAANIVFTTSTIIPSVEEAENATPNEVVKTTTLRIAKLEDADEFISRKCCLGRRQNDTDIPSLTLLTVRAMMLPSHLLLVAHGSSSSEGGEAQSPKLEGVAHCTYLENESTRLAFVKINALYSETVCFLLDSCLRGPFAPKDAEIESVYISAVTEEQQDLYWKKLFPHELRKVLVEGEGDSAWMHALELKGWNWADRLKRTSEEIGASSAVVVGETEPHLEDNHLNHQVDANAAEKANTGENATEPAPIAEENNVVENGEKAGLIGDAQPSVPVVEEQDQKAAKKQNSVDLCLQKCWTTLEHFQPPDDLFRGRFQLQLENASTVLNSPTSAADPSAPPTSGATSIMAMPSGGIGFAPVQFPNPPQQQPQARPSWAFTFRLEQPLVLDQEFVENGPQLTANSDTIVVSSSREFSKDDQGHLKIDDSPVSNTLARQIDRLQRELITLSALNDRALEALKYRVAEDQTRMKMIERAKNDFEAQYKERKRKLHERLDAARLQAELDASARCGVCHNDESYIENPIVICELCSWGAHQHCVGLPNVPEGEWFCNNCAGKTKEEKDEYRRNRAKRQKLNRKTHPQFSAQPRTSRPSVTFAPNIVSGHPNIPAQVAYAPSGDSLNALSQMAAAATGNFPSGSGNPMMNQGNPFGGMDPSFQAEARRRSRLAQGSEAGKKPMGGENGSVCLVAPHVSSSSRRHNAHERTASSPLLCVCQSRYDEGRFMLSCDECSNWFHPTCIGLKECTDPDIDRHPNCVMLENGTHTLDVADWTFKCPRCAQNRGKPSLTPNSRPRRAGVAGAVNASPTESNWASGNRRGTNASSGVRKRGRSGRGDDDDDDDEDDEDKEEEEEEEEDDDEQAEDDNEMEDRAQARGRPSRQSLSRRRSS